MDEVDRFRRPVYTEALFYVGPDRRTRAKDIAYNGVLEELLILAKFLNTWLTWEPSAAATFILTGLTPHLPRATYTWYTHRITNLNRISLELSTRLAPKRVAELYAEVRQQMEEHRKTPAAAPKRRARQISDKHLELAKIGAERVLAQQQPSWKTLLEQWNKQHPDWRYPVERVSQFNRDALSAYRRVLGQD